VTNADDVFGALAMLSSKVTHQAFHGAKVTMTPTAGGLRIGDVTPQEIGSVYRGEQVIVFGHYWGKGAVDVRFTGNLTGQPVSYATRIELPDVTTRNPEIERLWAFSQIQRLMEERADFGESADIRDGITDLAIDHGLVTPYTSMIVVREEVMEALKIERRNRDRLAVEAQAQAKRQAAPAVTRRADAAKPMFNGPRASVSGSGGGSLDAVWLTLIVAAGLVLATRHRRRVC
jgi:Ca-activated chloride channel family protein